MKAILVVALVVGCAMGALYPGASASVAVLSLKNMIKGLTPLVVPSLLNNNTILLTNYTVSSSLATIVVNKLHIREQIDF